MHGICTMQIIFDIASQLWEYCARGMGVMTLKMGALIKVRAFGGKEIVRRFIAKQNATILICSDEEYESARREKRKPLCVGFPLSDVITADAEPRNVGRSRRSKRVRGRNHHA